MGLSASVQGYGDGSQWIKALVALTCPGRGGLIWATRALLYSLPHIKGLHYVLMYIPVIL